MKRAKKLLTVFTLCLFAAFMAAVPASAAKKPSCAKSVKVYFIRAWGFPTGGYAVIPSYYKLKAEQGYIIIKNISKSAKISDVKSSNSKIKASAIKYNGRYVISVTPTTDKKGNVNTGSAKISFTVRQGGKKYKLSCKYNVALAPSPLKSLVINGKNYASSLKGKFSLSVKTGKTAKISFKSNSLLKSLRLTYYNSKSKKITVKNGARISVPKSGLTLSVEFKWKGAKYAKGEYNEYFVTLTR